MTIDDTSPHLNHLVNSLSDAMHQAYTLMGIDDAHVGTLLTALEYHLRATERLGIGPNGPHPLSEPAKVLRQALIEYLTRMAQVCNLKVRLEPQAESDPQITPDFPLAGYP